MDIVPKVIDVASQAASTGDSSVFAFTLVFLCFGYMILQSVLAYKSSNKYDIEIRTLRERLEGYDRKFDKLFKVFEDMAGTIAHLNGYLKAKGDL